MELLGSDVGSRLTARLGGRFTRIDVKTEAGRNRSRSGRDLGVTDFERSYHDWTFNAGLTWDATRVLSFNVLAGRGFRAPNLADLGALGLNDLGYEVPAESAIESGALIGNGDGEDARGNDDQRPPRRDICPDECVRSQLPRSRLRRGRSRHQRLCRCEPFLLTRHKPFAFEGGRHARAVDLASLRTPHCRDQPIRSNARASSERFAGREQVAGKAAPARIADELLENSRLVVGIGEVERSGRFVPDAGTADDIKPQVAAPNREVPQPPGRLSDRPQHAEVAHRRAERPGVPLEDDDAAAAPGQVERVSQTYDPSTDDRIVEGIGTHRVAILNVASLPCVVPAPPWSAEMMTVRCSIMRLRPTAADRPVDR